MKSNIPDIAYDRDALRSLLQNLIDDLRRRDITSQNWQEHYYNPPKFEYKYDAELWQCDMSISPNDQGIYELTLHLTDEYFNTKVLWVYQSPNLNEVMAKLYDTDLVDVLYRQIYLWKEGVAVNLITIPDGTTRIAPMIFDTNHTDNDDGKDTTAAYPLYRYGRIEHLVIPSTVDIPHDNNKSPFASFEQKGFVSNRPTQCKKIHINTIENHSPNLRVEDGVLYSADKHRLIYCFDDKTSFVVPPTVTTIEPFAFCLQKNLKEIILHNGITSIGSSAFMACRSLESVVIPRQLKNIPWQCFASCSSLRNIVLPEGLESIDSDAFRHCVSLKTIQLPDTLQSLDSFEGCSSLQEIEIPAGVERIHGFMFCTSLRKVVLHEGVTLIASYAFRYCDNLTTINFPEGLTSIGARAFYPASLRKLLFPKSLYKIESEAFYHNNKLHYVEFISDVTIEQAAFACCPLLLKKCIRKPATMKIKEDAFIEDPGLDKYGFWD